MGRLGIKPRSPRRRVAIAIGLLLLLGLLGLAVSIIAEARASEVEQGPIAVGVQINGFAEETPSEDQADTRPNSSDDGFAWGWLIAILAGAGSVGIVGFGALRLRARSAKKEATQ